MEEKASASISGPLFTGRAKSFPRGPPTKTLAICAPLCQTDTVIKGRAKWLAAVTGTSVIALPQRRCTTVCLIASFAIPWCTAPFPRLSLWQGRRKGKPFKNEHSTGLTRDVRRLAIQNRLEQLLSIGLVCVSRKWTAVRNSHCCLSVVIPVCQVNHRFGNSPTP